MKRSQILLFVLCGSVFGAISFLTVSNWVDTSTVGRLFLGLSLTISLIGFVFMAIDAWIDYALDHYERDLQRHNRDYMRNHAHKLSKVTQSAGVQAPAPAATNHSTPENRDF